MQGKVRGCRHELQFNGVKKTTCGMVQSMVCDETARYRTHANAALHVFHRHDAGAGKKRTGFWCAVALRAVVVQGADVGVGLPDMAGKVKHMCGMPEVDEVHLQRCEVGGASTCGRAHLDFVEINAGGGRSSCGRRGRKW
jgi:hypothetical protein